MAAFLGYAFCPAPLNVICWIEWLGLIYGFCIVCVLVCLWSCKHHQLLEIVKCFMLFLVILRRETEIVMIPTALCHFSTSLCFSLSTVKYLRFVTLLCLVGHQVNMRFSNVLKIMTNSFLSFGIFVLLRNIVLAV